MNQDAITLSVSERRSAKGADGEGTWVVRYSGRRSDRDAVCATTFVEGDAGTFERAPEDARARSALRIAFEVAGDGLACTVSAASRVDWYGAGLVAGPLRRNGRQLLFFNADRWPYDDQTEGLYQCHPYLVALFEDGQCAGVLADCAARGTATVGESDASFCFDVPSFDVYLITGRTPQEVQRALTGLFRPVALPPRFALGYHQCRWSYESDAEVRALAREFRERHLPCDAIWLDIGHMHEFMTMTWSPEGFPDPMGTVAALHDEGFRVVTIQNPGLLPSASNPLFAQAEGAIDFVRSSSGTCATGRTWPGECVFPDFRSARTRAFWAECVAQWVSTGVDGLWLDMNEPSVFDGPRTLVGIEHLEVDFQNTYGFSMATASYEALRAARPDERPFLLSRANTVAGSHAAFAWSGDNRSTWDDLRWSIAMTLSVGLCGQPFSGADVGGFDGDPGEELFVRWFQLGAFLPFFRGHSDKYSSRKEPWSLGAEVEAYVKASLDMRMRFIHVFYTLCLQAERTGLPVVRPLFFADPRDRRLRDVDDAFLLGDDVLVAPVIRPSERTKSVRLPRGSWYSFATGCQVETPDVTAAAPLDTVPLFVRAGRILPLSSGGATAERAALADLELHVFLDAGGRAEGFLFEDSGNGYAYRKGGGREVRFEAERRGNGVHLTTRLAGAYRPRARRVQARVHDGRKGCIGTFELDPATFVSSGS